MKLEQQVASLELSKRLKELGVRQESLYYWVEEKGRGVPKHNHGVTPNSPSAFTVAELGAFMLGKEMPYYDEGEWHSAGYYDMRDGRNRIVADTEADARAKMLIYLLENHLITLPQ